jgi:hypothetical protein
VFNKFIGSNLNDVFPFEASYIELHAALNSGWQLKEPVLLSSRRTDTGNCLSQFILNQPLFRQVFIIAFYWTPEIERFVNNKG